LVTQNVISATVARNVAFLHSHRPASAMYPLDAIEIERIGSFLDEGIRQREPLARLALLCDKRIGHTPGTSLKVARHLLANRPWPIDIASLIDPAQPVVLREASVKDIDRLTPARSRY